jgi:hypothetical protein
VYTNSTVFTKEEDAILMGNSQTLEFQHQEEEAGETSQLTKGSTEHTVDALASIINNGVEAITRVHATPRKPPTGRRF